MWLVNGMAGPEPVSSDTARGDLAWAQRPVRETIIDTAEDLIAHGAVTPKRAQSRRTRG